jgi:hypothetical protein
MSEKAPHETVTRRLQILLRIKHPLLDPDEITRTLGIEPEETIARGPSVSRGVRRVHSDSYWLAELSFPSREEIAAEAVRLASQKSSFKVDTSKLQKLTAGLSDFTSPKLSTLKEQAAVKERAALEEHTSRRERAGVRSKTRPRGSKTEDDFDFGRIPAFQEFLLLTRLGALECHRDFFHRVRAEGGSVTLLVHRPDLAAPFTMSSELARRLAALEADLEID